MVLRRASWQGFAFGLPFNTNNYVEDLIPIHWRIFGARPGVEFKWSKLRLEYQPCNMWFARHTRDPMQEHLLS